MSSMSLDWPSLSFDLLRDHLGAPRSAFPHTLFMVAGTQVGPASPACSSAAIPMGDAAASVPHTLYHTFKLQQRFVPQ